MAKQVRLFIIDPQFDFCDPSGALYVPGADDDMNRLAAMIQAKAVFIDSIVVTLDSHRTWHIAHPIWWRDKDGNHPKPFTPITLADVEGAKPKWRASEPALQKYSLEYIRALKANGRYDLMVWPPHCLIGSAGYQVYPALFDALADWERRGNLVDWITKGSNPRTEHYSAVKADVPDPADRLTQMNPSLLKALKGDDGDVVDLYLAGEALSHCVANTMYDVLAEFGDEYAKRVILIEDASSTVPNCEALSLAFTSKMKSLGMRTCTTHEFLQDIRTTVNV